MHAAEGLGDQCRADGAGRLAGAERNHSPPPSGRHRRNGHEIAGEVEDVARVVLGAEPGDHEADHRLAVGIGEADGSADAGVEAVVLGERRRDTAFAQQDLDQRVHLAATGRRIEHVADVKGGMRPGRLRQVLDGGGELAAASDQQHVARAQHAAQRLRGRRGTKGCSPGRLRAGVGGPACARPSRAGLSKMVTLRDRSFSIGPHRSSADPGMVFRIHGGAIRPS